MAMKDPPPSSKHAHPKPGVVPLMTTFSFALKRKPGCCDLAYAVEIIKEKILEWCAFFFSDPPNSTAEPSYWLPAKTRMLVS